MQVKTIFHTQLIKATSVLSSCCFQVVFLLTMNDVSPVLSINTHNGRVLVIVTCTISYTSSTVGGGQREHDRYVGVSHCAGQQRGVCGRGGGSVSWCWLACCRSLAIWMRAVLWCGTTTWCWGTCIWVTTLPSVLCGCLISLLR